MGPTILGKRAHACTLRRVTLLRLLSTLAAYLSFQGAPIAAVPRHETGFLDRSVTMRGVEYRYQVYVPREFDPSRSVHT